MSASPNHVAVRPDWLATQEEDVLEPVQPIIDSHHHLYDNPGSGICSTTILPIPAAVTMSAPRSSCRRGRRCRSACWPSSSRLESSSSSTASAMSASGIHGDARICTGLVGFADLRLGDRVRPILEQLIMAGGGPIAEGGRLCGIRQTLCWNCDTPLLNPPILPRDMADNAPSALASPSLIERLSFEAWAFFHQLGAVARLARAFPEAKIVVNHRGGVLRVKTTPEARMSRSVKRRNH